MNFFKPWILRYFNKMIENNDSHDIVNSTITNLLNRYLKNLPCYFGQNLKVGKNKLSNMKYIF